MKSKIKVMIVDDSLVVRTLLRDVLSEDPRVEVVSQAVNGRLALPRVRHYRPDLIILDHEMPEMSGIETLEELHRDFPEIGVIMFSSHTAEGAKITIRALELGALDFITKPDLSQGNPADYIRGTLLPLIIELHGMLGLSHEENPAQAVVEAPKTSWRGFGSCTCCAIGISTGGPAALHTMIPLLSDRIRGPILIVQHMPKLFTKQLAESLDKLTDLRVVEGEDGMPVKPGWIYIAPGGLQMEVRASRDQSVDFKLRVFDGPAEINCKPSVDILFQSVAELYGSRALGVIMTGMGTDGYLGMKEMKQRGSPLLAQSEASCLIFGMPALPTREKLVDDSLDISGLATRINFYLGGAGQ